MEFMVTKKRLKDILANTGPYVGMSAVLYALANDLDKAHKQLAKHKKERKKC